MDSLRLRIRCLAVVMRTLSNEGLSLALQTAYSSGRIKPLALRLTASPYRQYPVLVGVQAAQ